MWARHFCWGVGGLLACLAGCDSSAPYAAVLQNQLQAQKDLVEILSTVTDRPSMEKAGAELKKRFVRFQEIEKKAKALPKPSAEVVQKLKEDLGSAMELAVGDLRRQVRRILELPGGKEFLAGLEKLR